VKPGTYQELLRRGAGPLLGPLDRYERAPKGMIFAALPGLTGLLLFYSLAIHMHLSLGGWPTSIGEYGFPRALIVHSAVTIDLFGALFLSLFLFPIPILVCLLVERWRQFAVYFAVCATACLLCLALAQFAAPAQFLYWWND
jgi:hypothetical protein